MTDLTIIQNLPHVHLKAEDSIIKLTADRAMLAKRRWRAEAEDGHEFGFDLGEPLAHGAVFFVDNEKHYVVEQTQENVLEIPVPTPEEAARVAWNLGNLHFGVQVLAASVRVMNDPAVWQYLVREGVAYRPVTCVFLPMTAGAHNHHDHAHHHHEH